MSPVVEVGASIARGARGRGRKGKGKGREVSLFRGSRGEGNTDEEIWRVYVCLLY